MDTEKINMTKKEVIQIANVGKRANDLNQSLNKRELVSGLIYHHRNKAPLNFDILMSFNDVAFSCQINNIINQGAESKMTIKKLSIVILTVLSCFGLAMTATNDMPSATFGTLLFCGSALLGLGINKKFK